MSTSSKGLSKKKKTQHETVELQEDVEQQQEEAGDADAWKNLQEGMRARTKEEEEMEIRLRNEVQDFKLKSSQKAHIHIYQTMPSKVVYLNEMIKVPNPRRIWVFF